MNIWEWVEETTEELKRSGQGRLAELIDALPTACCDGNHERVESLVPEALALARALEQPWLELFVRHWLLQSRVLHRHDVSRDTMTQAVSLVEFASRPETRECPQGVCAVQDLASAYGLIDGVGYAEQRLAVTAEALERIDPSWPCFDCISAERASALLDSRRHEEALDFCQQQLLRRPRNNSGICGNRVRALLAVGRFREAANAAEKIRADGGGDSAATTKSLYVCQAKALLGEHEQAVKELPGYPQIEPEHYVDWLRCVRALGVGEGRPNTWHVERAVADMDRQLTGCESHFTLCRVHRLAAELALARHARFSVNRHLAAARRAAAELVDPSPHLTKLAALERKAESLPEPRIPASIEQLLEEIGRDPEQDLELLEPSEFAQDVRVVQVRARALEALGARDEALHALESAFVAAPENVPFFEQLLEALLRRGEHARLEELCERARREASAIGKWALARSLSGRGEETAARRVCEALLASEPEHHPARHLLAKLLRDAGELETSLYHLTALVEKHAPGDCDWDRMLVATLLGRWDLVRQSARRLELPLDPEQQGPVSEEWGPCLIRVRLRDGNSRAYFAWRTGPVTARIDEVVAPSEEQHHDDEVAFDAELLNAAEVAEANEGAEAEQGRRHVLREYGAFRILKAGDYRAFTVDGYAPEHDLLERLKQELAKVGMVWEQRSPSDYVLPAPGAEGQAPGIYAFIGLPGSCTDLQAHQLLLAQTEPLGLRLLWPALAEAAGDVRLAARQRELADEWSIELG